MKRLVIILLLLFPFTMFCETSDSTKTKKFEIGLGCSPDFCFRKLKSDASAKSIADTRDTLEIPKLGYTAGLNFVIHINKKITLATGILFSDKGEKTKKYFFGNSPNGSLPITGILIYHYHYLDIPIKANYYILTGKLKFFITAGISTNFFLNQKTTSILGYNDKASEKTTSAFKPGFSKINVAFIAGFGIDYPITDKFNFKMEPIYTRSITSIINAPIKSYLYSAGLNIGIYYKL